MKVKTVDGFQGGEEVIVIISCVRSNDCGFIGFLADPRRTNVSLTRARYVFIPTNIGSRLSNVFLRKSKA